MSTGETGEAVVELGFVGLSADCGGDEVEPIEHLGEPADGIVRLVLPVGVTTAQEIGPRPPEEVLHRLHEEEGEGEGEAETEPGGVPFPELAPPDQRLFRQGRVAGWDDEGDEESDDERGDGADDEEDGRGDDFLRVGEGDGGVGEGEWAVVGGDLP